MYSTMFTNLQCRLKIVQCLFPSWENYIPARDTCGKQLGGNTPTAEIFPSDGEYAYTLEIREESLFSLRECTNKTFLQCYINLHLQCSAVIKFINQMYSTTFTNLQLQRRLKIVQCLFAPWENCIPARDTRGKEVKHQWPKIFQAIASTRIHN